MNNFGIRVKAEVEIPGSKSLTHRALILAALAEGQSRLAQPLISEDTDLTLMALKALGADITREDETGTLLVTGTGGKIRETGPPINLNNSGTSMRLLASVAALAKGPWVLTGSERMMARPIEPLLTALKEMGATAFSVDGTGCPPIRIESSGFKGGEIMVDAEKSSQYLSSLLLIAAFADTDVIIRTSGKVSSWPYVLLTLRMIESFGVKVEREARSWFRIKAGQRYEAEEMTIPGDCSSAAYFWAAAAATGGYIVTRNIRPFSEQPDYQFLNVLSLMGCEVVLGQDWVAVQGGPLSGIEIDMNAMPDQVPTLAVLAGLAKGRTIIKNVAHLRYKESDRLNDLGDELSKIGIKVTVKKDGLIIDGSPIKANTIDPHNDHRLAMSFAVARLVNPEIEILDPGCVSKSFPDFWELFDRIS
jgi:3-phosphoshikimate 1-carboxyvinyltransferase